MKSFKNAVLFSLLLGVFFAAVSKGFSPVCFADELDDKLLEMQKLENEITRYKNEIDSRKKSETSLLNELQKLEDEIFLSEKQLEYTRAQMSYVDAKINETAVNIAQTEEKLASQKAAFDSRLVSMYKSRMISYVDVLLTSANLSDLLSRMHYLRQIAEQDVSLMEEYSAAKAQLSIQKEELEQELAQLSDLRANEENKRQETVSRHFDRQQYLRGLQSERETLEQLLDEMERESKALEQVIKDLQAKSGRQEKDTLSFMWPVGGGWISDYYGYRWHPILGYEKFHSGLDYAVPSGTPIKAAEDGTVIYSATNGGYGLCVILDHGGGISTLYGHASKLLVQVGQDVRKGDTLALVGSTGVSTGPHLHFEVRINGQTDDPLKWLP